MDISKRAFLVGQLKIMRDVQEFYLELDKYQAIDPTDIRRMNQSNDRFQAVVEGKTSF